jgi:ribosomal protein S18 acetylase RimI-like enzyme
VQEIVRQANPADLIQVYLMGFDTWSDGRPEADYLEACQASPKYKRGTWYVLDADSQLLSSLIVYQLSPERLGIGSIATPKSLRKKGYASKLLSKVISQLEEQYPGAVIFLYSEISPEFYERFGFQRLPPALQRYEEAVCMVRGRAIQSFGTDRSITPEYF